MTGPVFCAFKVAVEMSVTVNLKLLVAAILPYYVAYFYCTTNFVEV